MTRTTHKTDSRGLMFLAACGLASLGGSAPATADATLRDVEISDVAAVTDAIDPAIDSPLDDLLADWGAGSVYDLNCDATVNVEDYLILISEGIPDSRDFIGMMADWGQGSAYDLNCDGTVNIEDVLQMLEEMTQATVQPVPVNERVEALLKSWGEGSVYDLNCDGIVNAGDFLVLVTRGDFDVEEFLGMYSEWGEGSSSDLNCDGVVDTRDFLALLEELASEITQAAQDAA